LGDVVVDAKKHGRAAVSSSPTASNHFDKRVTLDLTAQDHRALRQAALDDGATMADILRALVALFREDHSIQTKVRRRLDL
jgi:hypothetical protein